MRKLLLALAMILSGSALAQNPQRATFAVQNNAGYLKTIPFAPVTLCSYNSELQCNAPVTIFSDAALMNPIAYPFYADANGYFSYYTNSGNYVEQQCVPAGGCVTYQISLIGGGSSSGSVTSVSSGNANPLFTSSVSNPTTTPAVSFTPSASANNTFYGNFSGSTGTPSFWTLAAGSGISITPSGSTVTITNTGTGISGSGSTNCGAKFTGASAIGCAGWTDNGSAISTTEQVDFGASAQMFPQGVANSGANFSSFPFQWGASYWNGSVAAGDVATMQLIPGSGANPAVTLSLTNSGSSGHFAFSVPSLIVSGISSGTSPVCPNGVGGSLTTAGCSGGGGSGTVTSFSAGNLSPLFTSSVASSTTTPALTFSISNAAQNSVLAGPASGGAGAYSFQTSPTFSGANLTNLPFMSLTTSGSSGAATLISGVLNIPNYAGGGGGLSGQVAQFVPLANSATTSTGPSIIYQQPTTNFIGIGTSSPNAPLNVGVTDTNPNASQNPGINISRVLTTSGTVFHGYADDTILNGAQNQPYSAFDARTDFGGSNNIDHFVAFQSLPILDATFTGTLGSLYGIVPYAYIESGHVTNMYGGFFGDYSIGAGPGGTVGTNYGVYVDTLANASTNWGVYVHTNKSYFGGVTTFEGGYISDRPSTSTANQMVWATAGSADWVEGEGSGGLTWTLGSSGGAISCDHTTDVCTFPSGIILETPSVFNRPSSSASNQINWATAGSADWVEGEGTGTTDWKLGSSAGAIDCIKATAVCGFPSGITVDSTQNFQVINTGGGYMGMTFNGNNTDGNRMGFVGGATGDPSFYWDVTTGGAFKPRVHNVQVALIDVNGLNGVLGGTTPAAATVTNLTDSALTSGNYPLAGTGGLLGNGNLSDTGARVVSAIPILANNQVYMGSLGSGLNQLLTGSYSGGIATLQSNGPSGSTLGTFNFNGYATTGPVTDTYLSLSASTAIFSHPVVAPAYNTTTNCASAASPAVCSSATAGSVVIPTGTTSSTLTVNTTAVTANSQIVFYPDDSLGTRLSTTCNSTLATLAGGSFISARTPGTSFAITFNGSILTNGVCGSYLIVN